TVRHVLVAGQVACAMVLLVAALLLGSTLWHLSRAELGFDPAHLLSLRVPTYATGWPQPRATTLERVLDQVRAMPGVVSASATTAFPLDGHGFRFAIPVAGMAWTASDGDELYGVDAVSPGYFRA